MNLQTRYRSVKIGRGYGRHSTSEAFMFIAVEEGYSERLDAVNELRYV